MWSGVTVMAHNLATSVFQLSWNSLHSFMQSAHNRSKPLLENLGGTPAQLCYGAGSHSRQKQPIFGSGWMHEKAAATQWGSINTVQRKLFWGVGGCEREAGKNPHWGGIWWPNCIAWNFESGRPGRLNKSSGHRVRACLIFTGFSFWVHLRQPSKSSIQVPRLRPKGMDLISVKLP